MDIRTRLSEGISLKFRTWPTAVEQWPRLDRLLRDFLFKWLFIDLANACWIRLIHGPSDWFSYKLVPDAYSVLVTILQLKLQYQMLSAALTCLANGVEAKVLPIEFKSWNMHIAKGSRILRSSVHTIWRNNIEKSHRNV